MGKFMSWVLSFTGRQAERLHRTQRLERITQTRQEINRTAADIREKVKEYQQAEDPLAELMKTLRPNRRRGQL